MEICDYIDAADAAGRFMNNEAMYKKFLFRFGDEDGFPSLFDRLENGTAEEAFNAAHTMKGLCANLSLKSINTILVPMTETLRGGDMPEKAQVEELRRAYEETLEVLEKVQKEEIPLFS